MDIMTQILLDTQAIILSALALAVWVIILTRK